MITSETRYRLTVVASLMTMVMAASCGAHDGGSSASPFTASGRWHTERDPASSKYVFVSPEGQSTVLRGISMTGLETGTRESSSGAGFWLFQTGVNGADETKNAPQILQNVASTVVEDWATTVVRIPICGSAWSQNYKVQDWNHKQFIKYQDWIDLAVKQARSRGAVVIIDNHLWAVGKMGNGGGVDRGTFTSNGKTHRYSEFEDGCTGTNVSNGKDSCAPHDWYMDNADTWECPISNADGVTMHNAYRNKDSIAQMWSSIASRYAGDSGVWFELFNEPYTRVATQAFPGTGVNQDEADYPWDLWTQFMQQQISAIRSVADSIVIVNGLDWGYDFGPQAGPIAHPDQYLPWSAQPNIAYGFHPYQHATCCGEVGVNADVSSTDPYESGFCSYYPDGSTWGNPSGTPIPGAACGNHGYAATQDKKMPPCTWVATAFNPSTKSTGLCAGDRAICNPKSESECNQVDPATPAAGGWSKYVLPMQSYGPLIATEYGSFDCSSAYVRTLLQYMQQFNISFTAWALFSQNRGGPDGLGACGYPSVMRPTNTPGGDFGPCLDRATCSTQMQPLPWSGTLTAAAIRGNLPPGQLKGLDPNDDQVKQADKDYDAFLANDLRAARDPDRLLNDHIGQVRYQAELFRRMRFHKAPVGSVGGVDDLLFDYLTGPNGAGTLTTGCFCDVEAHIAKDAVYNAYRNGGIDAQYIRAQAGHALYQPTSAALEARQIWTQIGKDLNIPMVGINPADDAAVATLRPAESRMQAALDTVQDLDRKLQAEIHQLGPTLSPNERKLYMAAYQKAHVKQYQELFEAADNLAGSLSTDRAALEDAMVRDATVTQSVYNDYKNLAQFPTTASFASDFANQVASQPNSPLNQAFFQFSHTFSQEIKYTAAVNVAVYNAAQGNTDAGFINSIIDDITWYNQGGSGWEDSGVKALGTYAIRAKSAAAKATQGQYADLEAIKADEASFGKAGRAIHVVAIAFGVISASSESAQQNYYNAVNAATGVASDTLELLDPLFKSFAKEGQGALAGKLSSVPVLMGLAKNAEHIGNTLGFVGALAQALADIEQNDGSVAHQVIMISDMVQIAATFFTIFEESSTPAGWVVAGAQLVTFSVNLIDLAQQHAAIVDEEISVLQAANITDAKTAGNLANADDQMLAKMGSLGLTEVQIRAFVAQEPDIVGATASLDNLITFQKRFGLNGTQINAVLTGAMSIQPDNAHPYRSGSPGFKFLKQLDALAIDNVSKTAHDFLDLEARTAADRYIQEILTAARDALI